MTIYVWRSFQPENYDLGIFRSVALDLSCFQNINSGNKVGKEFHTSIYFWILNTGVPWMMNLVKSGSKRLLRLMASDRVVLTISSLPRSLLITQARGRYTWCEESLPGWCRAQVYWQSPETEERLRGSESRARHYCPVARSLAHETRAPAPPATISITSTIIILVTTFETQRKPDTLTRGATGYWVGSILWDMVLFLITASVPPSPGPSHMTRIRMIWNEFSKSKYLSFVTSWLFCWQVKTSV